MAEDEKALRMLLCRLGETMLSFWLGAFSDKAPQDLQDAQAELLVDLYGEGKEHRWSGTCSHSPLNEGFGRNTYGTKRMTRYLEYLKMWRTLHDVEVEYPGHELVDGIPLEIHQDAWYRAKTDKVGRRVQHAFHEAQEPLLKILQLANKKEKRLGETEAQREARLKYFGEWGDAYVAGLNEKDALGFKEDCNLRSRRYRARQKEKNPEAWRALRASYERKFQLRKKAGLVKSRK